MIDEDQIETASAEAVITTAQAWVRAVKSGDEEATRMGAFELSDVALRFATRLRSTDADRERLRSRQNVYSEQAVARETLVRYGKAGRPERPRRKAASK